MSNAKAAKTQCKGKTKTGRACSAPPGPSGWCTFHDPAKARARAAGRRAGGQRHRVPKVADASKVPAEIRDVAGVLALLDVAMHDTIAQENSAQRTRGLVSISLAYFQGLKVGELEERMAALELALQAELERRAPDTFNTRTLGGRGGRRGLRSQSESDS